VPFVIEALSPAIIGRPLGQNLYNQAGNLLLRKGTLINQRYFEFFKDKGYDSILLMPQGGDQTTAGVGSDRLLTAAPYLLKKMFKKLRLEESVYTAQAKAEIISLAESIFIHFKNIRRKAPQIIELKRRDDYLYQHSVSVCLYSLYIGEKLGYSDNKLMDLAIAALIHDFGMEFVDGQVLKKDTELNEKELAHIREHTKNGFSHLVKNCSFDGLTIVASAQHHERFDGDGYPKKLVGNDIDEFSRIVTLTDAFDAWTSDRPHRRLQSAQTAMTFIQKNQNKIFDPTIAQTFMEILLPEKLHF